MLKEFGGGLFHSQHPVASKEHLYIYNNYHIYSTILIYNLIR